MGIRARAVDDDDQAEAPNYDVQGFKVPARVQAARDERGLDIKTDELAIDPTNPDLQKDVYFAQKGLGKIRARAADEAPPVPPAPRASQADVRKVEAPAKPMRIGSRQEARKNLEARIAELEKRKAAFERHAPTTNTEAFLAEVERMDSELAALKGELENTGVGSGYSTIGSIGGGIGGAMTGAAMGTAFGGPIGGVIGGALGSLGGSTAGTAAGTWIDERQSGDTISDEEADEIMRERLIDNAIYDAAGNLLLFVGPKVFRWAANTAKGKGIIAKYGLPEIAPNVAPGSPTVAKANVLATRTGNPERQQAVRELVEATEGGYVPTPGQVSGEAGFWESLSRGADPRPFARSSIAMEEAVKKKRNAEFRPVDQGTRKTFGQNVLSLLDTIEKSVKERTGKIFDKAQGVEGQVNMQGVLDAVDNTLQSNLRAANRPLSSTERADLEELRRLLSPDEFAPPTSAIVDAGGSPFPLGDVAPPQSVMSIKDAMNFISGNKARLRGINPGGKPGNEYSALITRIDKEVDDAVKAAIEKANPKLRAELEGARADYREMMETAYDDAAKAALRANPEDILDKFVQTGNVSEVEQYQRALAIAQREGKINSKDVIEANQRMARGFLQGTAKDPEALATWSARLDAEPKLRETWDAITKAPGGAELQSAMGVLEQMAQVALARDLITGGQFIPVSRATHGGMGISLVTGTARLGMMLAGVGLSSATKALGTMYTQGEKGMINHMMRAMRAAQAGTPAAIQGAKQSFIAIEEWAKNNGEESPFIYEEIK